MPVANICFTASQGKDNSVSEQNERLKMGNAELHAFFCIANVVSRNNALVETSNIYSPYRSRENRCVTRKGVLLLIKRIRALICRICDTLSEIGQEDLLESIADIDLELCGRIDCLVALKNPRNTPSTILFLPVRNDLV